MTFLSGDVLLYSRNGFYGRLIQFKTWSRVSHVEVICNSYGPGGPEPWTAASRNGQGVNYYHYDPSGLYAVLRPVLPFDLDAASAWFQTVRGQGYDWLGLLAFASAKYQGKENGAMFCSEFAARYLRAGGIDPFLGADADSIAPSDFAKNSMFRKVTDESVAG